MSRKFAISHFKDLLAKLRSTPIDSAEHVAAEANVQAFRWTLCNLGLSETEIAQLVRG